MATGGAADEQAAAGELVQLYVYDLSGGLARSLSPVLLGRQLDAVYHTAIVVGGMEYFFGSGVNVAPAGRTPLGQPMQVLELGRTQIPREVRDELLADLAERYTAESYNLFRNNCNNFSDELAQLLCGVGIPQHITGMPDEVLSTPFGQMIAPMLHDMERQMRGMRSTAIRPTADAGPAAAAAAGQPAGAAGGPGLHAAEVELEAAVAEGMMRDAQQRLRGLTGQAEERAAAGPGQAAAPARADDNGRLELELAVRAEFERIMAVGGMAAHEAQALALESVAAQRSLDMQRRQPAGAQ